MLMLAVLSHITGELLHKTGDVAHKSAFSEEVACFGIGRWWDARGDVGSLHYADGFLPGFLFGLYSGGVRGLGSFSGK